MTVLEVILSLRPVDQSPREISAAIERARVALANADDAVVVAQREHDAALLDTDEARFVDALKKLGKLRLDTAELREKVAAVMTQLEGRLVVAKRGEAEARVATARANVEASGQALVDWWEKVREQLDAILSTGRSLDAASGEAYRKFMAEAASVSRSHPDMDVALPQPTRNGASRWPDMVASMTQPVRKPFVPLEPSPEALEREERLRIGTENYVPHERRGAHGATPAWPN